MILWSGIEDSVQILWQNPSLIESSQIPTK